MRLLTNNIIFSLLNDLKLTSYEVADLTEPMEPIGRKSIRKTLESLKAYVSLKSDLFKIEERCFLEMLEDLKRKMDSEDNERRDVDFLSAILDYSNSVSDLIRALLLYIEALESYISELDETFDSLLGDARRAAEQQMQEIPRDKPSFYG